MDTEERPQSGRDQQISRQSEDKRREAGKKKEGFLEDLSRLRDTLALGEDSRMHELEKIWKKDCTEHRRLMLTSHETNNVFSSRGFFGAYTLVLDWRVTIKNKMKQLNKKIQECDMIIDPPEKQGHSRGEMDMTDNKPAG